MDTPIVAITQGDTNGVGLEVVLKALADESVVELFTPVVFANHQLVKQTFKILGIENLPVNFIASPEKLRDDRINFVNVGREPLVPTYGEPTPASGAAAVESLVAACNFIDDSGAAVLVTAPINKSAAQVDGFDFPGHTEYLGDRFGDDDHKPLMILFDDRLRVALLTTHLPLKDVSAAILRDKIEEKAEALVKALRESFEIERPKLALLSLNPHCGDEGLLGSEEREQIIPAIENLREKGLLVFGPYAADGFFASDNLDAFDGVLAMYHDQGLAPFKALARCAGVNYTAGLPVVRTSPDHGTAYDIAGRGEADPTSMRQAIYAAIDIWRARRRYAEMSADPLKINPPAREKKKAQQ